MTERFQRLRAAFEAARAEPDPLRRERLLLDACGDDASMLAELREMLANEPPTDFLAGDDIAGEPAAPPDRLGEFELIRKIGDGGSGVVWLAHQPSLDRQVALKVTTVGPGTPQSLVDRFHREPRAVARLAHPHIVPVFADGQSGETHWFAMQYIDGHSLDVELRLQRQRLPNDPSPLLPRFGGGAWFATVARLCADAADALQTAHEHGIVHRDVKPPNLLLDRAGHVLVADFGIARDQRFGSLTEPGTIAGTWHYMSPEQARIANLPVDHRTDVYSLGVVMYEMLTLQRPFEGRTSLEVFDKIRRAPPRPVRRLNHHVPRDLETICMAAMAHRPEARYATAQALRDDLQRFLGHEAIEQQPPSWRARVAQTLRAHRIALLVAGVLVVSALLGAAATMAWNAAAADAALRETAHYVDGVTDFDDAHGPSLAAAWRALEPRPDDARFAGARDRLVGYRDALVARIRQAFVPRAVGDDPDLVLDEREQGMHSMARAATVFPGDAAVAGVVPTKLFADEIVLQVTDAAGAALAGTVTVIAIDALSSVPDDVIVSSPLPLPPQRVRRGMYRFEVRTTDGRQQEYDRWLGGMRRHDVRLVMRTIAEPTLGMVRIAAGDLHLPITDPPSKLAGARVPIEGFWIDRCEVTVAEFRAFVVATGRSAPPGFPATAGAEDRLPVAGVTFDEATAYAEWAGKRLPTYAEWMLTARGAGPRPRQFPWGDEGLFGNVHATWDGATDGASGIASWRRNARPVDQDPRSGTPEGVLELYGNVEEWTGSVGIDRDTTGLVARPDQRIVAGFTFYAATTNRGADIGSTRVGDISPSRFHHARGFRCARSTDR